MRLLLDCRLRFGIERVLRNVVPLIANSVDELTLLGEPERLEQWAPNARNVRVVEFRPRVYSLAEQLRFPFALARRVDLLHVPHFNIPLAWRAPMVATVNDLVHLSDAVPAMAVERVLVRGLIAEAIRRSRQVLTLSEFTRRTLVDEFKVAPDRVTVGLPGVDRTLFHSTDVGDEQLLSDLPIAQRPFLLVVGSLRPHKNLRCVLLAYHELRLRYGVEQPLLVVGAREGFRLKSLPVPLGPEVAQSVHYCGYVRDDQLAALYRRCSVFIFMSLYEGFGLPPLEAMACGAPVVTSNRTSLPEVVGDAGLLVDPSDISAVSSAIYRVLSDRSLALDLRSRAMARARTFTWKRLADVYLDAYRRSVSV